MQHSLGRDTDSRALFYRLPVTLSAMNSRVTSSELPVVTISKVCAFFSGWIMDYAEWKTRAYGTLITDLKLSVRFPHEAGWYVNSAEKRFPPF